MDTNNWSPPPAGDTAVVTSDWRAQLPPDSRLRIVNKIMETLKRHLPFSGQEGLQELKKIAVRFEEKIYFAAKSQQDYLRKISLKMLTMEGKSQNTEPNPLQSNSLNNSNEPLIQSEHHNQGQSLPMQLPSNLQSHQQLFSQNTQNNTASAGVQASLDSTCQTGHSDGGDWQEEVYQKIKALKETYLPELNEMHQKIVAKFQQNESVPQPPMPGQVEKLKVFKHMLERVITFLQIPKHSIAPNFKEKLGFYEKQIINFINSNRRSKPPSQQLGGPGQILPTKMHSMQHSQSQITQIQSHENPINPHAQPMNLQGSAATMQQSSIANLQHSSESQQKMMHLPQPGSKLVSTGQGYALISMPWAPVGSLSQRPVLSPQQTSKNAFQNLVLKFILILLLVIVLFQLVSLLQTGESTYSMAQFPLVKWFVG